ATSSTRASTCGASCWRACRICWSSPPTAPASIPSTSTRAAKRAKTIAGAGLDVWDKEPPPPEHPLLQFDNVIASPHTAGMTREARANMGRIAAEQLIMVLDGKRPPRVVNPQVWPAYARRFEQSFGFRPQD